MSQKFRCLCFATMLYYSTERIFSAGGLTVTNLRASLDETKVEAILLVHLNLMKVDQMEKVGKKISEVEEDDGEVEVVEDPILNM